MSFGKSKRGIQFVEIRDEELQPTEFLQLRHACLGIDFHGGFLYISSHTALYKYTVGGQLVERVYEDLTGSHTVYSFALSSKGRLFVTNFTGNRLITINAHGEKVILTDPDLVAPTGVCVANNGTVYVCCLESHTVIQVHPTGQYKLATVARETDGIFYPQSVWFNKNTGQVFIGQYSDSLLALSVQENQTMRGIS